MIGDRFFCNGVDWAAYYYHWKILKVKFFWIANLVGIYFFILFFKKKLSYYYASGLDSFEKTQLTLNQGIMERHKNSGR